MGKYDTVEIMGPEKDDIAARIFAQIAEWGLKLPEVPVMPFHFGLNDFETIGETEFWIANEEALGYCGKFLFVFDGQTCPYHLHKLKHETFFIVKGSVRMLMGDEERIMKEGDLLAMPPFTGHSFTGIGPCLVLEVSMPSILNDNFFKDRRIGNDGVI